MTSQPAPPVVIEVFADVICPFTHVGLCRFVERRAQLGRHDVALRVRAWPLEVVNGVPTDAGFIAEEVEEIRRAVAPDLFKGFDEGSFPGTTLPALALADAAYRHGLEVGETVSLAIRDLLFEQGVDVSDAQVLADLAARHGLSTRVGDAASVLADHAEGLRRGVIGSPHFFTPTTGFFCPALDVSRDAGGHLRILSDPEGFDAFMGACFGGDRD